MKTMKHLKEFESPEDELVRDLDSLGFEDLKGWYLSTVSEDGYFYGMVFIARNESEAEKLFRKAFTTLDFPPNSGKGYKVGSKRFMSFFEACRTFLMMEENNLFSQLVSDLKVKNASSLEPTLITFPAYNPFLASEMLNQYFYNVAEKMTASSERDYFEEESSTIEL